MSSGFVAALDQEIAKLENELRADVRYAKLAELKRVRDRFYASQPKRDPAQAALVAIEEALSLIGGRKPSPNRDRILSEAEALVRSSGSEPVPTSTIHDHLLSIGIVIAGDKPVNNLSAMISNSRRFKAHGRRGWTMLNAGEIAEALLDELPDNVEGPNEAASDEDDEIPKGGIFG